jgi:hypothetical protein
MSNLLYTIAVILVPLLGNWFFAYSAGSIIHILLVIAISDIIQTYSRKTTIIKINIYYYERQ